MQTHDGKGTGGQVRVPINSEISNSMITAYTSWQEAYRIAVSEFALYEIKTEEDVDILIRLATDAQIMFDRYLQAHTDAKMYMCPLRRVG